MPDHSSLLQPRRVGVCGSSMGLSAPAVAFCVSLGRSLAVQPNVVIASGATKRRSVLPMLSGSAHTAEWHIVNAAQAVIPSEEHEARILTFHSPGAERDASFPWGRSCESRGRTGQARRFSFVRALDALIAIAGRRGTSEELSLASELGIPILPVPSFGDASAEHWNAYRKDLLPQLRLTDTRAREWERLCTKAEDARELAGEMVETFMASLPKQCFVIMPFDEDFDSLYKGVIEVAVKACGDVPVRTDLLARAGDVLDQIRSGLRHCDYAVAVVDLMKPNVLYELGIAHAWEKPVILLNRHKSMDTSDVPFDIAGQQRLQYRSTGAHEAKRLAKVIRDLKAVVAGAPAVRTTSLAPHRNPMRCN
ncbi:hypothetical protein [Aquabacterium humicola]|uniref:hypothetical protein n=1 Tax=Aquabacterium humicola TaxID=3237377 RepID=UPI002543CC6F|nr:hypothetical protein [Rubrivivax pictus]